LPHLVGQFDRLVADVRGLDATVFGALVPPHPRESGDEQKCRDRDDDDDDRNDSAGSGVGSLDWLSMVNGSMGWN
jgi:hypothetical protein